MLNWFCRYLAFVLCRTFIVVRVKGGKNIPSSGAFILASNHESNLDPIILGGAVTGRKMNYMAKDGLFKKPGFARFLRALGVFSVKRDSADFVAIKEAVRRLKKGLPLVIFPGGARGVRLAQPGVGFIAVKTGVPVVPAFIFGSKEALPKGATKVKLRTPVCVVFGKPFKVNPDLTHQEIATFIMQEILKLE